MIDATFTDARGRDAAESFSLFVKDVQPRAEDLAKAGQWLVDRRRAETLSGRDVDGGTFAAYSPAYALRKGSSLVNLYSPNSKHSQHMLDALTYQTDTSSGQPALDVGIFGDADTAMRARVLNEGGTFRTRLGYGQEGFVNHPGRRKPKGKMYGVIPARHWLGVSDSDLQQMETIIVESATQRSLTT